MNKPLPPEFGEFGSELPAAVDLRGLEAPEPLQRILLASTRLGPRECYLAHLPHVPHPLFPHLEARGLEWRVHEETDGSALLLMRRGP